MKAVVDVDSPLMSLIELFSALSAASIQRRFVEDSDLPSDPNALPVLIDLATNGAQRPSTIADRLHVSAPTASRLVFKLEQVGLVAREPDPADGRAFLVSLSPAGASLIATVLGEGEKLMSRALASWPTADRDRLAPLLRRLHRDFVGAIDQASLGAGQPSSTNPSHGKALT